jgi:hypothetical protein
VLQDLSRRVEIGHQDRLTCGLKRIRRTNMGSSTSSL